MSIHNCKECNALEVNGVKVYRSAWLMQSDDLTCDVEIAVDRNGGCSLVVADEDGCASMDLTADHLRSLRHMCHLALQLMEGDDV